MTYRPIAMRQQPKYFKPLVVGLTKIAYPTIDTRPRVATGIDLLWYRSDSQATIRYAHAPRA
jgi:hypothetical protein